MAQIVHRECQRLTFCACAPRNGPGRLIEARVYGSDRVLRLQAEGLTVHGPLAAFTR